MSKTIEPRPNLWNALFLFVELHIYRIVQIQGLSTGRSLVLAKTNIKVITGEIWVNIHQI
jgi:hypothetical protein